MVMAGAYNRVSSTRAMHRSREIYIWFGKISMWVVGGELKMEERPSFRWITRFDKVKILWKWINVLFMLVIRRNKERSLKLGGAELPYTT